MAFIPISHPIMLRKKSVESIPAINIRGNGVIALSRGVGISKENRTVTLLIDREEKLIKLKIGKGFEHEAYPPRYHNITISRHVCAEILQSKKSLKIHLNLVNGWWLGSYAEESK
ncbi:hypothetical protein [Rosenbergiella collisarenosi]|uniref:hypothetical protein n=1 Tax=Rosenbergiella collisarenosi TaxID=1544695 RepID=UPI001F4E8DF7|nr:hypothetical protein [Rosenbergiella collisarenosi]